MKKLIGLLFASVCGPVSLAANSPSPTQPRFGRSYDGGLVQKWMVAQNSKAAPADISETSAGLDFSAPQLETKADTSAGLSVGPFTNLNFGGALDMRIYLPRMGGATESRLGFGSFDIHVSELFLTTNIGDHVSILAEQLLITDPMGSTTGQDHGFVYAIFSTLPGLPEDVALKVGRMRFRFGIDAKLDSAANPLHTPVYKTLGIITDKGIEISGYSGIIEWSLAIANGVANVMVPVVTTMGEPVAVMMETRNGSKPVVARVGFDVTDSMAVGLSGFSGKTYPVTSHYGFAMHDMVFNGHTDTTRLIYKNRAAIDAKFRIGSRWDVAGEYAFGNDRDRGQNYKVWSGYGRIDYRMVPQKWTAQFQYDYFDDGRDIANVDGMAYRDSGNIGLGLTYYPTEQAWIRAAWMMDDRGLLRSKDGNAQAPEYLGVIQIMLSF